MGGISVYIRMCTVLPKSLSCRRLRLPTSSLMVISSTLLWFRVNCWATSMSLFGEGGIKEIKDRYNNCVCSWRPIFQLMKFQRKKKRGAYVRETNVVNLLKIRKWLVKVMKLLR